jgi:hypothetical protein
VSARRSQFPIAVPPVVVTLPIAALAAVLALSFRGIDHLGLVVPGDDGELHPVPERVDRDLGGLLGRVDAGAGHRSGVVDDDHFGGGGLDRGARGLDGDDRMHLLRTLR